MFGDPTPATAAKGEQILAATVEASLAVLADFLAE
ncbi:creatininase family protein [Agromyces sp. ISL-38]|nr:creatininase family protein [Agromyces sp. ISL-38]